MRTTASGLLVPDNTPERITLSAEAELSIPAAQRVQSLIQTVTPEQLTTYANDQTIFRYPPYLFGTEPVTQQTLVPLLASPEIIGQLNKAQRQQLAFFSKYFFEKLTIIEGKKGSGKTQMAIALAYKLRRMFNLPVLADQVLFPKFGPYRYFSEADLVDSLTQITNIVKQMNDDQAVGAVQWAMRKHGIMVMNAVILLDEAYKYFERQISSNKLVRLFGYFIAEMRHYHCTIIICVPSRRYITTRVQDQVDILAKVAFDKEQEKVFAMLLDYQSGDFHSIDVDSKKYRDMYDSWAAVGLRQRMLDVKGDLR